MSDNAFAGILDGSVKIYSDPENETIVASKAKKPMGKVTVGVVNHGVLESISTQSYMPVEQVELEKVFHAIPSNIKQKYSKGLETKKELLEARTEMLDRMEEVKRKKQRLVQLAAARSAKGAARNGI